MPSAAEERKNEVNGGHVSTLATDELFEMASLFQRTTGLPMPLWVSPRRDVRVKVNMAHGNQMTIENTAVVGVRLSPHLIAGQLSADDERSVFDWLRLNEPTLVAYWDGNIDTGQLVHDLKVLPPRS